MSVHHNILITVDNSEATDRAVTYVALIIGRHRHFRVQLFHIAPIPPKLLEFGKSENGQLEDKWEADISEARVRHREDMAQAVFAKAQAIFQHSGVPVEAVKIHVASTIGFDGVDLANLCNEAALTKVRHNRNQVTMADFEEAQDKIVLGGARPPL